MFLERLSRRSILSVLLLMLILISFILYAASPQYEIQPRGVGIALWDGTDEWATKEVNSLSREQLVQQLVAARSHPEGNVPLQQIGALISYQETGFPGELDEPPNRAAPLHFGPRPWFASLSAASGGDDFDGSELLTLHSNSHPRLAYGVAAHSAAQLRSMQYHNMDVLNLSQDAYFLQNGPPVLQQVLNAAEAERILSTVRVSSTSLQLSDESFWARLPYFRGRAHALFPESLFAAIGGGARVIYLDEQHRHDETTLVRRLRDDEAFDGLIIVELSDRSTEREIAELISAGSTLIVTDEYDHFVESIHGAIHSGYLTDEDLREAVSRLFMARAWLQPALIGEDMPASTSENGAASLRLATMVYQNSLTLLRDRDALLPLSPEDDVFSIMLSATDDQADPLFIEAFADVHPDSVLTSQRIGPQPTSEEVDLAHRNAAHASTVLVTVFPDFRDPYRISPRQVQLLDSLADSRRPLVIAALGPPEILGQLPPEASTIIWSPSQSDLMQHQIAESLHGSIGFWGSLPRNVNEEYRAGHGLITPPTAPVNAPPEAAGIRPESLRSIDQLLDSAIQQRAFPGAAAAIGRAHNFVYARATGSFTYDRVDAVSTTSLYDLASLTKPIATTTAIMQLYERGEISLEDPVAHHLPAFGNGDRSQVTIEHLLTHRSGLPSHRAFHLEGVTDPAEVADLIMAQPLASEPGERTVYSDLGFITLALVVEAVTGQPFAEYVDQYIFRALRMYDTSFRPVGLGPDPRVVPTELDQLFRQRLVHGDVHDETAYLLGGASGHAGLFSTAEDLALFAHMLVNDGAIHGKQFLQPETIELFTTRADPRGSTRALGWDTRSRTGYSSAGQRFGPNSFGHTGFTGTSFWIDPDEQLYVILLTNRVHPTRENRLILEVRPQIADLAFDAIEQFDDILLPGIRE